MDRRSITLLAAAVTILNTTAGGALCAAQQPTAGTPPAPDAARGTTAANKIAAITGQTLTSGRAPAPFFPLRLRELDTGLVVGRTTSDHAGQFSFTLSGGGMFVAEVLGTAGEVLAVGDILTIEPGEAVGVAIVLPPPQKSLAGFFGNTAAAIVQAAAGAGITAVTSGTPVTPEQ